MINNFIPSELDAYFKTYQNEILEYYEKYQKVFKELEQQQNYDEYIQLNSQSQKPCKSIYIKQQNDLLKTTNPFQTDLEKYVTRQFHGFTSNRLSTDKESKVSSQCSFIQHSVDFNKTYSVMITKEQGIYNQLINQENMYYVVFKENMQLYEGNGLTVKINGQEYDIGNLKVLEFYLTDNTKTIEISSLDNFIVYQYKLEDEGNQIQLSGFDEGLLEVTFTSYVSVPAKITFSNSNISYYVFPNDNNEYFFKNYFTSDLKMNIELIIDNDNHNIFNGIIRNIRWWRL